MTTLKQGGVMQRAVSFVGHLDKALAEFDWHVLCSKPVSEELARTKTETRCPLEVFDVSPARNSRYRKLISEAIGRQKPDLVFTFAGPSYLSHTWRELMGVADGWVTHSTRQAYASVPGMKNRLGLFLASRYKLGHFRKSRHFTVQTETARRGLADRARTPMKNIHVVPNALASWYRDVEIEPRQIVPGQPLKILYFAAAYSHKRHDLLPEICLHLKQGGLTNFSILVTLPEESAVWQKVSQLAVKLDVAASIVNIGPVPVTQGLELYRQCQISLVPSILETFSATYLEAMATNTPSVVCDLDFAREICGDAAAYFSPSNAKVAASRILELVRSPQQVRQICEAGRQQLTRFPDIDGQMKIYRTVFHNVLKSA